MCEVRRLDRHKLLGLVEALPLCVSEQARDIIHWIYSGDADSCWDRSRAKDPKWYAEPGGKEADRVLRT